MEDQLILAGKNALITGASRGFGALLSREFWKCGANLCLAARSLDALMELKDSLLGAPATPSQKLEVISVDLADSGDVDNLARQALNSLSQIDILVNNAAIQGPIGPVWEVDVSDWEKTIRVDFLSPVQLTRALIPQMIENGGGKVIFLSGGGSTGPRPNFSAYGAAKTALVRFCETLAHEAEAHGIDVNCVAPGQMKTKMTDEVLEAGSGAAGESEFGAATKISGFEDICDPRALRLCNFLASSESDGISGRLISAIWDKWECLSLHTEELKASDAFTLRRILPEERGLNWD